MTAQAAPAESHQRLRTLTKGATLIALALVPVLGIFRIDLARGALMVLERPVNLRDFTVIAGLAIVVATGPLVMVTTLGTYWCGWACPQNTLSEWASRLTHRLLGSRANVDVERTGWVVAPSKNRVLNWLLLGCSFLLASMALGLIPLLYFFPPGVVWELVTFQESAQFAGFMQRLYLVAVGLAFVDIAVVRYFLCNYACLYRFGNLLFRNKDLPGIRYDAERAAECSRCNYCRVACVPRLDPTALKPFDRCINCAECVDACAWLHQVKRTPPGPGLLKLARDPATLGRGAAERVSTMVGWHGMLFIGGLAMLLYGLWSYA